MLSCRGLKRDLPGSDVELPRTLFHSLDVEVKAGERLFVVGRSGSGKSLLLRVLAQLDEAQAGTMTLAGKTPEEMGLPQWRCEVCYVTQARWAMPGTPSDSFQELCNLAAQRDRPHGDPVMFARKLLLDESVMVSPWITLSGGQAQRAALAVSLAMQPQILLLDEVTSACDPDSTLAVEATLKETGCTLIWVSHDPAQPPRVGGRTLRFPPNEPHDGEEGPPV
jgi:ABC-type iron transport system FetAB ATPase subunit